MSNKLAPWNVGRVVMSIGFFRSFYQQLRLSWKLFEDPRVPIWAKVIPILTLGYVLSPIDLALDFIPVIGQMDDIAVVGLGMNLFIRAAPQDVVNEYQKELERQDR